MERSVLFISAPLEGDVAFSLQELISRANRQGVHVNVWLVASPEAAAAPAANQLRELATQTGGQFFAFSGDEPLPSPEEYLKHLRSIYHLEYVSQITSGGTHQVVAEVQYDNHKIESPVVEFDFDLQPPDPAFIFPPVEIRREIPEERREFPWGENDADELAPREHNLQILVDFPDGRIRPLQRTALYVDGVVVDEYTITGQYILRVEALDNLGLTGSSIETPVQVIVNLPAPNPISGLVRQWPAVLGLVVLLSGAVLMLVLIMRGRIRPRVRMPVSFRRGRRASRQAPLKAEQKEGESAGRRMPGWVNRLYWPHRRLAPKAAAYLTYTPDLEETQTRPPIPVAADELTFGRDPSQATVVLDDPSVDSLHARLIREEDGSFRITDEGSVGGTWVNYTQVKGDGAALEHGDLVHIGRVGLRFSEREPRRKRVPVITLDGSQG